MRDEDRVERRAKRTPRTPSREARWPISPKPIEEIHRRCRWWKEVMNGRLVVRSEWLRVAANRQESQTKFHSGTSWALGARYVSVSPAKSQLEL